MSTSRRLLQAGILAAVGALGWAAFRAHQLRQVEAGVEIAVFLPGPNESTWSDFVEGVRLAANEANLAIEERPQSYECVVATRPVPLTFHWHPEVGARHIQRRVRELCARRRPPVAFVGSSNSELTRSLGSEIRRSASKADAPLLLMTHATADDLIALVPDRTFRFGFCNSRQARMVVERLKERLERQSPPSSTVKAIVLQVADDEFSVDLAARFVAELRQALHAQLTPPPARFQAALAGAAGVPAVPPPGPPGSPADLVWTLGTATGRFDEPSPAEWELARQLLGKIIVDLESQWVVCLPAGAGVYRRLAFALSSCLREMEDRSIAERVRTQLVVLSGDSLDFYAFAECALNQLAPEESPAPVIFFAHADPLDRTVAPPPNRHIPSRGLNREVARALIAVVGRGAGEPTPRSLAGALAALPDADAKGLYFERGERRTGGAAVLAVPRPEKQHDFELTLPSSWRKGL